jgi:uncharacterized cupin superfamily protein
MAQTATRNREATTLAEERQRKYLVRADEIAEQAVTASHPWNPNSEFTGTRLAVLSGLTRIGVSLMKVPPGKESFVYHSQEREEEWIYVISGRGVAEIEDEEFEVGSGDFMGFPTGIAHHLRNPYEEDLVYLVGGENVDIEVANFPRLGRRIIRKGEEVQVYRTSDATDFGELTEES